MDIARPRQRSASHGSLHQAYKAHGRYAPNCSTVRGPSQRRPLRSVNENSTLLRSPGPLESMLKTTTETGDIGIFSIKAGTSPSTYHQPPRTRPYLADAGLLPAPRSKPLEDGYFQDEQKRLRSYRDTTSEIISLYGADNQQYWLRSASPTTEDGHRSYSLTTCSSRQIPSQKSSGTLQSHSSGSGLQRPRSPFPYPTRLKRPGVRPASPALAENGGIDYSRMVELDRVSQRTTHGSYKPTYALGPRRPPPLSLRPDANRSTASLPSRASPGPCHFGPGPSRIRTPNSSLSGLPRPHDRVRGGSTDQSVRSASVTSIVEMYQRPITAGSAGPALRSGGSFYYDYTEEFDKAVPQNPALESEAPICPIPQRAGSNSRPMVLRDDTQVHLDSVPPDPAEERVLAIQDKQDSPRPVDGVVSEAHRGHSRGHSIRSIDDVLDGTSSNSNLQDVRAGAEIAYEPGLAALVHRRDDSRSTPPISEPCVTNVHVYATASKTDGDKLLSGCGAWRLSKTLGPEQGLSESLQDKRSSQSSLAKLRCTLDPALSEFASLFSSFDRLAKSPFSRKGDDNTAADDEHCTPSTGGEDAKDGSYPRRVGRRPSLQLFNVAAAEGGVYRRRHRRNAAAMRINTAGLNVVAGNGQDLSPQKEDLKILSPEPFSPVRQLRVKNSIPQLMKALPPLPGEAAGRDGRGSLETTQQARRRERDEPAAADKEWGDGESLSDEVRLASPGNAQGEFAASPAKFKLRVRTSSSPSRVSDVGSVSPSCKEERHGCLQQKASSAAKPRLKLKLSRSRLGQAQAGNGDSVLRTNRLKQCNSLADLAVRSRRDAHAGRSHGRGDAECRPRTAAGDGPWEAREAKTDQGDLPPPPCDGLDMAYPPSADKVEELLRSSTSTNKVRLSEMRSFSSDMHPVGQRGLRQKLSMFRLRITGSSGPSKGAEAAAASDGAEESAPTEAGGDSKGRAISTRSDRVGGRVRRWASDAKQAVRSYVRRRLDRSQRLSG